MAPYRMTPRKQAGLSPGTIRFAGQKKMDSMLLRVTEYDAERIEEREARSVHELFASKDAPGMAWINVDGLHEDEALAELGAHFGLHDLVMEDVVHTHQRPKFEEYPEHIYIVMRMLYLQEDDFGVHSEQVSLVFGRGWVLSFQERVGDIFEGVRERLRAGRGKIRRSGADYLAYALADALVDHHFKILDHLGERIESLEEGLLEDPTPALLQQIHRFKRDLMMVRRAIWPLREVIGAWMRSENPLVSAETSLFLSDVYDHTVQLAEAVESYRDILGGLQDLYMSSISNRMNENMKVLTLISTIFIPLSFMAGIFGMNFDVMPELHWRWGYLSFWILSALVGGGMLVHFKRKRWY